MRAQKCQYTIDAMAVIVHKMYQVWDKKEIIRTLLIDVKRAFDHVSRLNVIQGIKQLEIDNDRMGWTQSFLINRKVEIVVNRHFNLKKNVETNIP